MATDIEEQLTVKRAIMKEFDMVEKKVSEDWLDTIDCPPDKNNSEHWSYLLYSKKHFVYVNLRWFPSIAIEPGHTNNYTLGHITYKKTGMTVNDVLRYIHNILDKD